MRNMVRWTGLIGAIALSGLGGCYGRQPGPSVDPTQATTVRVDNQAFNDMKVYVVSEGQDIRIGTATGHAETVFTIPPKLVRTLVELRFRADPIGGQHEPVSQGITVRPGDQVLLQIPP